MQCGKELHERLDCECSSRASIYTRKGASKKGVIDRVGERVGERVKVYRVICRVPVVGYRISCGLGTHATTATIGRVQDQGTYGLIP